MNSERNGIEKIRRRAKDNKAKNSEYFLTLSFSTLDRFRNLLITLSVVGFGFVQSEVFAYTSKVALLSSLLWSVIFGILNYVTSWFSTMYEANYYSKIESIFSIRAYPTQIEYEKMIRDEDTERLKKRNNWWRVSLLFLTLQSLFLLIALKSTI